jgi:hypothetical protein
VGVEKKKDKSKKSLEKGRKGKKRKKSIKGKRKDKAKKEKMEPSLSWPYLCVKYPTLDIFDKSYLKHFISFYYF